MLEWFDTDNKQTIQVTLTLDTAEVITDYLVRKIMRLEDAHLEDSYCYPRLCECLNAIDQAKKEIKN